MTHLLITPKLKDALLSDIVECGGMCVETTLCETADEYDTSSDIVGAIYDQFEEMRLIKQRKCLGGTIIMDVTAKAHDLYTHGGFVVQEEILKANIEKLSQELEVLSKQLEPKLLEKANLISTIGSNILGALAFFSKP